MGRRVWRRQTWGKKDSTRSTNIWLKTCFETSLTNDFMSGLKIKSLTINKLTSFLLHQLGRVIAILNGKYHISQPVFSCAGFFIQPTNFDFKFHLTSKSEGIRDKDSFWKQEETCFCQCRKLIEDILNKYLSN